jgi:hypothetical protein
MWHVWERGQVCGTCGRGQVCGTCGREDRYVARVGDRTGKHTVLVGVT